MSSISSGLSGVSNAAIEEWVPPGTQKTNNNATTPKEKKEDPLANKTVFLQLLVSQIKHQNPMEPADSIQYITQLNQFSATEQLVEIRKLLENTPAAEPTTLGQS